MSFSSANSTIKPKSRATAYRNLVSDLSSRDARFRPLDAFLSPNASAEPKIHVVKFQDQKPPCITQVEENELEAQLLKDAGQELYLVENISPKALWLLGGYCEVDPQFFLDYLDMVLPTPSTPKRSKEDYQITEPLPWYRLGDVENHLPPLRSVQKSQRHVHIRFIGPREYYPSDPNAQSRPLAIDPRLDTSSCRNNVRRIAGGYQPIHVEDQKLWPVAMTRHSAAAWFDNGVQWRKGIVLLDPPFIFNQSNLERQNSKYRSFAPPPTSEASSLDVDTRDTYRTSLLHYLRQNTDLHSKSSPPIAIVQDLYRIITSEWIAVNAYLERDLNAIEWRLECDTPTISMLDFFLEQLFIMRRRTRKYEALISDHLRLQFPSSWLNDSQSATVRDMEEDFQQVQDLIHRNNGRITQTVSLITSLMSVIEGKRATTLNQRLAFLTILATIALPFNVFAAVFGMQTEYGPGQDKFWVVLAGTGVTVVVVLVCYLGFLVLPRFRDMKKRVAIL